MGDTNTTVNQLKPYSARASAVLITMLERPTPSTRSTGVGESGGGTGKRERTSKNTRGGGGGGGGGSSRNTVDDPRFWRHPLALHLYIHLTEPAVPGRGGPGAGWGESAADLIATLNLTGSGHLEHMPGKSTANPPPRGAPSCFLCRLHCRQRWSLYRSSYRLCQRG